jgi:hypothetical protein
MIPLESSKLAQYRYTPVFVGHTKVSGISSSCFQRALYNSVRRLFALYGFKYKRSLAQLKPSATRVTLKLHSNIRATLTTFALTSSEDYAP